MERCTKGQLTAGPDKMGTAGSPSAVTTFVWTQASTASAAEVMRAHELRQRWSVSNWVVLSVFEFDLSEGLTPPLIGVTSFHAFLKVVKELTFEDE